MSDNSFRSEVGKLMDVSFDENYGYQYTIWFDYTKKLMREMKAGDLLSVPNFSYSDGEEHYSILSATSIMPFHYATAGDQLSGYPVFLEKTRDEAYKDFLKQDEESSEETTKIKVTAAPTGLELVTNPSVHTQEETQMPIFGGATQILDVGLVGNIFNSGLDEEKTITIGNLRKGEIDIDLKVEDLIRTHIGIFGYTGTGKSNLVSTLVHKLLQKNSVPVNIVIFDLMGEYTALLADVLNDVNGYMCFLGKDSLPKQVQQYMTDKKDLKEARDAFIRNMVIPVPLRNDSMKLKYEKIVDNLLSSGKIKLHIERYENIDQFLEENIPSFPASQESKQIMGRIFGIFKSKPFDKPNIESLEKSLKSELQSAEKAGSQTLLESWLNATRKHSDFFEPLDDFKIDRNKDLVDPLLSANAKPSLYIIQSEDEDSVREFAYNITANPRYSVYAERRKNGLNSPLTLFIFDEADEFIPQDPSGTYKMSSEAVETLARRGRKFGLGVAIATQRVTYLNTSIMAQPHTYFISKLPRMSDRQRVVDAFGTSEEVMRETFKFGKGDWLAISHDATGLKSVPIPIHSDNAEQRIREITV